ncbi:uncharacterized protein [Physcomitrium patens]|uniref:uncharacterized protein isoform X1 n=1 Tax=Physcomitrium patens TaxID=3218 RepID=UPI000D169297|nr:uncharacterized protein LOC112276835 isoform X1 [Physcomitrium patens]XP_024364347.1 uncharacterized protein LOC112276835 isoform X1 [Physcomitrium patens]XP_024364349.1 uncharacterized protein LOC112276835 isoform X1 [Physcomitrium patens]XP_024364350.1 uncharacterized protein LOC112276835 isoform X1 [Physcomitrium patens]|eukprot:XP_024364346.1 uncharacterized protein LOC112276835 isoform X1 [Physcomitrella patens]
MGGCLGACAKPPPPTPSDKLVSRRPRSSKCRARVRGHIVKQPRDWWTTSSNEMENHNTLDAGPPQNVPSDHGAGTASNTAYSNHALALWNQQRSAWVGTQPRPPARREPREPAISWNTTYEELLSTSRPFAQPIPLLEMVDFLVDVWEQEGLYERR